MGRENPAEPRRNPAGKTGVGMAVPGPVGRAFGQAGPIFRGVEVSERIQCPYCGQPMELVVDTSIPQQRFTTDCEVCCRPFEVFAECEPGEVLALDVQA